ncbi:MAG: right-handed parallel beta-helix repeat-containing protein [Candidatus Eisenbacteria bacterium]|nr:right-handed parallel beta-helix repeat-containing protein [Candidatus Eisenbacteria bacterium]
MSIPARTSMEWEPALFLLAACLFAALLIPAEAQAATLHVRQDSGSSLILIQQAINQSTNGDVIIVAAGTYVENIDFMGKNITLTSESGPAATIIDGSSRDSSVVVFKRGETRSATIEGFTITGGRGSKPFGPLSEKGGGGIFALNSSPTIQNNTILGNSAIRPDAGARVTGTGGGIACGGEEREFLSAPLIQGNTIRQNQAGANGGGIAACGWASPTIVDNLVEQNSTVYGDGGGVYLLTLAEGALINSNLIISNSAGDHGGGVYGAVPSNLFTVSCEISRNLIWRNRAEAEARTGDSGGGVWLATITATVRNNTIVGNQGVGTDSTWGGGIVVIAPCSPVIERNIIADSQNGGGIRCRGVPTPRIENNIFWHNGGGSINGECSVMIGDHGNIQVDPQFCNADLGDFSPAENSPALFHTAGPIGAILIAGCPGVLVLVTTWSALKSRMPFSQAR